MKINPCEQSAYFHNLREIYGEEVVTDEAFMKTAVQQEFERQRHDINAQLNPKSRISNLKPDRFLFMPLQKCTFKCQHCWIFGSPDSDCVLNEEQFHRIKKNLGHIPQMTVSGGEFFLHSLFREILSDFPVQCIYSNGFWGYPNSKCRSYLQDIKAAVDINPEINPKRLTMILSYDNYHTENFRSSAEEALSGIISTAYELFPEMNLRISQLNDDPGTSHIMPVIEKLKALGFEVLQEEKVPSNGNIKTISYQYRKSGLPVKTLFADIFPLTRIGRAVFRESNPSPEKWWENMPLSRHQFIIGPDGGIGLYKILYAPPVPYRAGNLIETTWNQIIETVRRDPIAIALQMSGLSFIWEYLNTYNKKLALRLKQNTQSIQQFMYLLLIDPERRLLLNRFLTERLYREGIWS
ncbi:MAG: hypothetical protein LBC48_01915 [Dysgonamonadaceae bacterium]|jgi:hypothetical protein|nr:hypothetical protein [Dysgonamonadaceae bacterium]